MVLKRPWFSSRSTKYQGGGLVHGSIYRGFEDTRGSTDHFGAVVSKVMQLVAWQTKRNKEQKL